MAGSARETSDTLRWQRLLLPFMVGTIAACGVIFLAASAWEIVFINRQVAKHPELDLAPALHLLPPADTTRGPESALATSRLHVLALLEVNTIERRYHQANALLLFSVLTRYLGFVTGMILVLVGASFILGKLSENETAVDSETLAGKWGVRSSSPGLLLAVLGTILMITAMTIHFEINVADAPVYFPEPSLMTGALGAPPDSVHLAQQEQSLVNRVREKLKAQKQEP